MHKNIAYYFFIILCYTAYQHAYAHSAGGGSQSYEFDKSDSSEHREREAQKKAAEEKQNKSNWGDFMKSVHKQRDKNNEKLDNNDHTE